MADDRSRYFQEIARHFLARRGAPFFLSAKDLDLVSSWERAGIPLPVVLEGIESALDGPRAGSSPKGKVMSLSFCRRAVERAFGQHRDRKVGGSGRASGSRDKRALILPEVEKFLARIPPEVSFLGAVYSKAREMVSGPNRPDEELERLDEEVRGLLSARAASADREAVRKELVSEYRHLGPKELETALEIKLVKVLRDRYRIPYLSPFYY